MASARTLVLLVLCFFLILTFYVPDTDSSRGGFRSGYRSRTSYRSTRVRTGARVRVRQRVGGGYYGGRIRRGSSLFSSSTWKAAALAGAIYGGSRYLRSSYYHRYPNRMPPICTNNYEVAPNGRIYGHFICPLESDPADHTWCCGENNREFCCSQNYYSNRRSHHSKGVSPFAIVGVILVIIVIIAITIICCRRYKQNGAIFGRKSPGHVRTVYSVSETPHVTVPLKTSENDQPEMKAGYQPANQPNGDPQYPPPGPFPPGGQYPPPPPGQYPPAGQYPPGPYPPAPEGGMPYPPAGAPPPYPDGTAPPYTGPPPPGMPTGYGGYGQPTSGYPPYPPQ